MIFIETKVFTKAILSCMGDAEYARLQDHLVRHPDSGDLIPGGGGLRKVRWKGSGRGKRGGTRIIYYWEIQGKIYMLLAYPKNKKDDLTAEEKAELRKLIEV